MKSFFKNFSLVSVVATLAVFACYYILFSKIKQKNEVIADASLSFEVRVKRESAVSSLKKVLEDSRDSIVLIQNNFIPSDGAVAFIEYLEALGKSAQVGVLIQDVKEVEESADSFRGDKEVLRFRLTAEGSFRATYRFLNLLENAPYVIHLEQVEIRKNSGSETLVPDAFRDPKDGVKLITSAWRGDFDFTVLKNK